MLSDRPGFRCGARGYSRSVARNIQTSGKTAMANKEIAECAYRLALGLRDWKHPNAVPLKRVVTQIMLADRGKRN